MQNKQFLNVLIAYKEPDKLHCTTIGTHVS